MKVFCFLPFLILASCTISFENISTHGTAEDVSDTEQTTTPNISPDITIPVVPGSMVGA